MDLLFSHATLLDHIKTLGYLGVSFIVFAESGLFFGFFLPGDSLLFTAGLLASSGFFSITLLCILLPLSAIIGDSVGYWFGRKIGPVLFTREDSFLFHKDHLVRTQLFYEKYGTKAIILGRFIPVVRTFIPILAGIGMMRYSTFIRYNIVGGLVWALGLTLLGYLIGNRIPNIDTYLLPLISFIVLISFLPLLFEIIKIKKTN